MHLSRLELPNFRSAEELRNQTTVQAEGSCASCALFLAPFLLIVCKPRPTFELAAAFLCTKRTVPSFFVANPLGHGRLRQSCESPCESVFFLVTPSMGRNMFDPGAFLPKGRGRLREKPTHKVAIHLSWCLSAHL